MNRQRPDTDDDALQAASPQSRLVRFRKLLSGLEGLPEHDAAENALLRVPAAIARNPTAWAGSEADAYLNEFVGIFNLAMLNLSQKRSRDNRALGGKNSGQTRTQRTAERNKKMMSRYTAFEKAGMSIKAIEAKLTEEFEVKARQIRNIRVKQSSAMN